MLSQRAGQLLGPYDFLFRLLIAYWPVCEKALDALGIASSVQLAG
jgi:hypothetical protein